MDALDRKILAELDRNPRVFVTRLAKKARVSQQVADYRLKRFVREGIITKFGTIVNLKALGLEHYRMFFTFNAKKQYTYEKIFHYLKEQEGVYWAARIGGTYDLLVVLFVRDFAAYDSFIDALNAEFPGLIKDCKSTYAIEHELLRHKYLARDAVQIRYGYDDAVQKIDGLDCAILSLLKDNCRLPALEIAERTGVSYKTVIARIKALEKKNIILGYRLFMQKYEKRPFIVLFSFKKYSKKEERDLLRHLRSKDEVTQLVRLFGIWNLFLHARVESNEQLQELLVELRDRFELIDEYEIIPVFEDITINLMPFHSSAQRTAPSQKYNKSGAQLDVPLFAAARLNASRTRRFLTAVRNREISEVSEALRASDAPNSGIELQRTQALNKPSSSHFHRGEHGTRRS